MNVILKKDIDNLGYKNDLVTVKNGYGRNFLIPKGFAKLATPGAIKVREEDMRQRAHREAKLIEDAQAALAKIRSVAVKVGAKAGEADRIFGSVNNIQVAEAVNKLTGMKIDRRKVTIVGDAIKSLGKYKASVQIYKEVEGEFEFEVVAE